MKYTNSTTDKIYSKAYDCYLDEYLDGNERNVELLRLKLGSSSIISDLNKIGIKPGTETHKKIAENMPQNSILIYHKMNEAVDMYPERTGLLVVIKGLDKSRVSFEYSGMGAIFRGFYNDWDDNPDTPKWSGWTDILKGGGGGNNTGIFDTVVTRALGGDAQPIILMHSSFDGNNKNLGRVDSPFANVYTSKVNASVTSTQELHVYSIRSKDGNPVLMHQSLDGNNKNLGRPESPFNNIYGNVIRMATPSTYTKSNDGYITLQEYIDHKLGV